MQGGLEIAYEMAGSVKTLKCDRILLTIGRVPNSDTVALEKAGLSPNARRFIDVDKQCRTKVRHIFAIGDVAGGMLLAHKASREGIVAAEAVSGKNSAFDTTMIPAVVFTDPEIASVGYTSAEATAKGFEAVEAQFPFAALGKALATGETEGFAKIVFDRKTNRLLGVHIVGAEASALLGEAGLALEMGADLDDLASTIHAHPTLPESLMEAAEVALGHPIHVMKRR
jgi:dihydrolipoamide dehydrogenase